MKLPSFVLSQKFTRNTLLVAIALAALVMTTVISTCQKAFSFFSWKNLSNLQASAPEACRADVAPGNNERKQLFVSCDGFLD